MRGWVFVRGFYECERVGVVSRTGRVGECARLIWSSSEPWPFPECQQEVKGRGGGRGGE